jgi:type 1 glutamine amidotransferase
MKDAVRPTRIDAHFVAAGKYHDIDFARLELLKLLAEHPQIRTTVDTSYADIPRLNDCHFLITYTCDVIPDTAQVAAIRQWVERGGRWLALHGTNAILRFVEGGVDCPDDAPDFMAMLGSQFLAHPPIGPFTVEVVNHDHDLTRGIGDFDIVDELYLSRTTAPIDTLMQAHFTGDTTGFIQSSWPATVVPILYTRDLGKGRIVYNTLGHCRGHYDLTDIGVAFNAHPEKCAWDYPVYYDLLRRGIAWAMGSGDANGS